MLQNIRDNAQGTIAKVIVFLIAVTFALFGVESIVGGFQGEPEVASVNGESITESEFARAVDQRRRQVLSQMGANADPTMIDDALLRQSVLASLIEQQVMLQAAKDKGLVISPALVDQYIRSVPAFQVDGQFNREAYANTLRSVGMPPTEFRKAIEQDLLLQQDREAVRMTSFVMPKEIEQLVQLDRQTRDFSYVSIPADRFADEVSVSEDEIKAFYQANPDNFRLPERVVVEYLELNKSSLVDQVNVSEEALRQRYEQDVAQAQTQEERKASHILIEIGDEQSEQQALAKVQEIQKELQGGAEFGALAEKYSQDVGSANAGGDLGYATEGVFVPEFEEVLFSLKPGEVSEPVKTDFGYHLIKLNDIRAREMPSFEEMKDQLTATLKEEQADALYLDKLEQLADVSYAASDLEEPASQLDLEAKESPVLSRQGSNPGVFSNPRVLQLAFSEDLREGHNSEVVELGAGRAMVLRLKQYFEPEVQPLAAVQDQIKHTLTAQKALEQASRVGGELLAELQGGATLEQVAEKADLEVRKVEDVRRGHAGISPEVLQKAFSMPQPSSDTEQGGKPAVQGFAMADGSFTLIALSEVTPGNLASFKDAERETITDMIRQNEGGREYALKAELLREQAEIDRS